MLCWNCHRLLVLPTSLPADTPSGPRVTALDCGACGAAYEIVITQTRAGRPGAPKPRRGDGKAVG